MIWVILIVLLIIFIIILKRSKKMRFDSVVMVNGTIGSGKTLLCVNRAKRDFRKSHAIWWRRKHIYSIIFKKMKNEEEPLLYSNIPIYKDKRNLELFKYYVPLTNDIIMRKKRVRYHSVMLWDESSLMATSMDYKQYELSEQMSLFLKLLRHECKGSYRNIFGSHANLYINTQSKNDNHYAVDRIVNQVLYITKSISIPFFKVVWVRDLLLIDSVQNEFNDDIKESLACRWFLIPKKTFNMYDSYSYEFLSHDFPVADLDSCPGRIYKVGDKICFEIATFHEWQEIKKSNAMLRDLIDKKKEKELKENG